MATLFNSTISVIIKNERDWDLTGLEGDRSTYMIVIEIVILLLMWLTSIPANILVCIVIYRSRRVQSTTNYFVISLAFSDLLMSLFCIPFVASRVMISRWALGSIMCRLVRFVQTLAPTTAIFILVSISIDRFYTIIYPLSFKITRGTAKHLIVCCWMLSFVISIFSIYFYEGEESKDGSNKMICPTFIPNRNWASCSYGAILVVLTFLIPTIFVVIVYSRIFRYVWTAGVGKRRHLRRTMNPVPRTKVKMLKMLIIVSMTTFLCAAPFFTVQFYFTFSSTMYTNPAIFIATFWLLYLPTVLKPTIYMLYNTNFRRGCREVFCMSHMKCYRSNTYEITTASNIGKKNHVGIMPSDTIVRTLHSPTMAFNRNITSEKTAWPMSANISTTYI